MKTNKTKTLATLITQDTVWRQTKQRHWQPWLHKIQGEDKQNKDTGNLDYTRYRVKKNKTKTLATLITQDTGWRQTKQITLATLITQDTGWRQTKQRHWQPWLHKIQGEDKQTKDTGNLDYTRYRMKTNKTNNTGNLDYTRYRVKTNKTKTLTTLITQDTGWRQTKQRHWQPWLHKIQDEEKQNKDTGNLDYTKYRVKTNKTKTLATLITQDTGWRQTKQITLATLITQDTVWRQTKQRHWQPWLHKIQGEDKQNKDTGNLDYTRYRMKRNKTKTLATLITQDTGWRQTKQRHWQPWLHKIQCEDKQNKDTGNLYYTRYRVKTNKRNNTGNLDYTRYSVKTNKAKTLATLITQDTGWRQTKQRHWQPWLHKIQGEEKQKTKTLATLITQDTGWRQTKKITLATLITQDTVWRQTKQRHWQPWLHKILDEEKQNKDTDNLDYTRYRVKKSKTNNTGNLDYTRYRVKTNKTNNTGNLDYIRYRVKKNKTNNTSNLDYTRYRMKTNKTKTLVTLITQDTGWRQTKQRHWQPWLHKIQGEDKQNKDTGNLDYTRYRVKKNKTKTLATLITQDTGWRKTKQRHWQPWLHKIQGEDKQNKDTGNLDYTRYRVKTNKTKTLVTLITQDTGWRQTKQRHWQTWLHKIQGEDKQNK